MQLMRSARGLTVIVSLVAVALLVGSCCGRAPVKKPPSPVWTVEVTPVEDTNPTKTQHTFIATVFDRDGRPLPNVALLGAFAALTEPLGLISIGSVGAAIRDRFPGRLGDLNLATANAAFAGVRERIGSPAHA